MNQQPPQYTLAFVGQHESGKTSLIRRMLLDKFIEDPTSINVGDGRLSNIPPKAVKELQKSVTSDFDPFYRVSDHRFWNEKLIFNLFDMTAKRGTNWKKGVSFCDGVVFMLDLSKFVMASDRCRLADEIIGKTLLEIFATSSVLKDLIVVVNKIDLVEDPLEVFDFVRRYTEKTFKQVQIFRNTLLKIIPMSVKCEENIIRPCKGVLKQYETFRLCLEQLQPYPYNQDAPFRMIHYKTYSCYGLGRVTTGKVISGSLLANEEFMICQSTLRKTFQCTSQGQALSSYDIRLQQSVAGELLACNLFRGWALQYYAEYYGPMTYFKGTTCKPCVSYFTAKLSGPVLNMKLNSKDDLILHYFGFRSRVDLVWKSKALHDQNYIYATFKFKDTCPAFTLERFSDVPEMSRISLFLHRIIGYGIVTDIIANKYSTIRYSFLHSRLFDSHHSDILFQFP